MTLPYPLKIAVAMNVNLNKLYFTVLWIVFVLVILIRFPGQECLAQVYISQQARCENYNNGSCVHASTITNLNYLQAPLLARYIRNYYRGGDYHYGLNQRLQKWGLQTYSTFSSSKRILDYAHTRKLPAVISYHRDHSCLFLGWYVNPKTRTITHAYVLNPNDTQNIETPTYTSFMRNWTQNDGEAVVIVPQGQFRRKR